MIFPPILTPFTDLDQLMRPHLPSTCTIFEIQMAKCLKAYGPMNMHAKCWEEYEDLQECRYGAKHLKRYQTLRIERLKAICKGEKDKYIPDPPAHSYSNVTPHFIVD
ncbi:uncharacterized protein LOC135924893 isoform X2 [Gordionus sp. m RMFG-2023]|uniref:uncharacterized protein LOC135924893 isoform X2 n=1 Tax=Gordionus sp. m RMFG-2023 TaxID=3053472 RepID=UPI0031FCA19C